MKTWFFRVRLATELGAFGKRIGRDQLVSALAQTWQPLGLVGVNQGIQQTDDPDFKWDRWTVDAGLAPANRDWVGDSEFQEVEFYFTTEKIARTARESLSGALIKTGFELVGNVELLAKRDWNKEWKKSFRGCEVGKYWKVVPPADKGKKTAKVKAGLKPLVVNPGAGFGTGTHETTQLCLEALAVFAKSGWIQKKSVLDFGSGSGILSVAAALTGAKDVIGVEIDPLARDNAQENSRLNGVTAKVKYKDNLPKSGSFDLVIANILKPTLLEFCKPLVGAVKKGGKLVLSGLMENDVTTIKAHYARAFHEKLCKPKIQVSQKNEWYSVLFEL